ncbi:MAG: A/G-specific adenine glycosylase [Flavobacteriaceae bacterium]
MDFTSKLIQWYRQHKRDLPWRKTKEPYRVWLSEIMLQQTRIDQGLSYYLKFIETFPTVHHLASASEEEVLKLWQGLGYYSRARNLHHTARYVVENGNGKFADNYKDLLALKGIGDYTASAIASICYNEPQAVVDGNVYRVLSRVFGIKTPVNATGALKEFKAVAQKHLDSKDPGEFNQALMEFGALYCKPQNPDCNHCIFKEDCYAFNHQMVTELPVKTSRTKVRNRFFNYLVVLSSDDKTILEKRTASGIWKNLYQFPLIEKKENQALEIKEVKEFLNVAEIESISLYSEKPVVHKLSHQHLHIQFWIVYSGNLGTAGIPFTEIEQLPVPIVLHNFIVNFSF